MSMRIVLFAGLVISLIILSVFRTREEVEQQRLQQLKTSYSQLENRSGQLRQAISTMKSLEQSSQNAQLRSALEDALRDADNHKNQIQTAISALPKVPAMVTGVRIVGGGESQQVTQLKSELGAAESRQQALREQVAKLPTTSPDSIALKDVVLSNIKPEPTAAPPSSVSGTSTRLFAVQVGITAVFGLLAIWTIVSNTRGKTNAKNQEWAFATIGTIVGFWLKG
jgi:hypothetical protein